MPRRWRWVLAVLAALLIGAVLLVAFTRGDDDDDTRDFFSPATPATCEGVSPVELDEGRFAAFAGSLTATGEDQLLVVTLQPAEAAADAEHFGLSEPGATYEPVSGGPEGALVFRVPRDSGAFKLRYDGGCGMREWIVP